MPSAVVVGCCWLLCSATAATVGGDVAVDEYDTGAGSPSMLLSTHLLSQLHFLYTHHYWVQQDVIKHMY